MQFEEPKTEEEEEEEEDTDNTQHQCCVRGRTGNFYSKKEKIAEAI